jgi:hypothetical protein
MSGLETLGDVGAIRVAEELGGVAKHDRKWSAIRDVDMVIILKHVDPKYYHSFDAKEKDVVVTQAWLSAHIAYPKAEDVLEQCEDRPGLRYRLDVAIMRLYGEATKVEVGKVEI